MKNLKKLKVFFMINNDLDALNIICDRLNYNNLSLCEKDILSIVKDLMVSYSFVENQTYPRPSHPNLQKRKDAYFTLIAILLSLRTTLENEMRAVDLFIKKYHSIDDVVNCDKDELIEIIKCSGMPQKKASTILEVSNYIISNYNGDINNIKVGSVNEIREKLLQLPGVGEKSADCMLELAFDLPSIVVDINVFRVVSRLYFNEANMNFNSKNDLLKIKKFLEDNIIKNYKIYQIVHTIILLHGKYVCRSNPNCVNCLINSKCNYYSKNTPNKQLKFF